ncbi:MAG: DNA-processing protein DprA [Anaerolineae bacterium]|nr:DNA-processing protein DprA [Anaerolineae bacterium]
MSDPIHTCRQYRLLITGSRQATPEMLAMAQRAVSRAHEKGWMVIVGDNPQGVDAAVIEACDALGVKVLVCGTTREPRKASIRPDSYWQVVVEVPLDEEYPQFRLYSTRDRWMVELCDRMLAIWNGQSRGTQAGYDYARQTHKKVNLITFQSAPKPPSRPPEPRPLHTVEVVVDASDSAHEETFEGVYGLRALDGKGTLLYDALNAGKAAVHTSDGARMQMLITALERLTARLKMEGAEYRLKVFQSSKNVEGWLVHGWKRNVPEVQRLTARIDTLLQRFPDVVWVKLPRAQVTAKLDKIGKGGAARP